MHQTRSHVCHVHSSFPLALLRLCTFLTGETAATLERQQSTPAKQPATASGRLGATPSTGDKRKAPTTASGGASKRSKGPGGAKGGGKHKKKELDRSQRSITAFFGASLPASPAGKTLKSTVSGDQSEKATVTKRALRLPPAPGASQARVPGDSGGGSGDSSVKEPPSRPDTIDISGSPSPENGSQCGGAAADASAAAFALLPPPRRRASKAAEATEAQKLMPAPGSPVREAAGPDSLLMVPTSFAPSTANGRSDIFSSAQAQLPAPRVGH